jgi:hypothetical protein
LSAARADKRTTNTHPIDARLARSFYSAGGARVTKAGTQDSPTKPAFA